LKAQHSKEFPTVLIAHTIKGKGVSFMENTYKYHYADLTNQELEDARSELTAEVM
jgi:transketolase